MAETAQAQIDDILEGPLPSPDQWSEERVDQLVDVMQPRESEPWPDLQVVFHLAEHPAIAEPLRKHALPARLEAAIGHSLEANLPLLGIHPYGPTYKLVELARQEFDKEQRKFDLVTSRLEDLGDEEAAAMVARYLGTDPAPVFETQLEGRFPDIVQRARARGGVDGRDALQVEDDVAEALKRPIRDPDAAVERLIRYFRQTESPDEAMLAKALADGSPREQRPREQRVAVGWMAWHGLDSLVSAALGVSVAGSEAAPLCTVLAALTDPERARNTLSLFLTEVTLQNPEEQQETLTPERVRAILSMRYVLPHLDSPIEPLPPEDLPELPDPSLRAIPQQVEQLLDIWRRVLDGRD
jgi:hypothetical protein